MTEVFVKKKNRFPKKARKILGAAIIGFGVLILLYFFFPIISYQMFFGSSDNIASPIPRYALVGGNGSFGSLISQGISGITTDYNDARNWYPQVHASAPSTVPMYTIAIPKLKIEKADVSTVDYDLANHLVQYAGTALPGQKGTAIIFGHSTLPQWFDVKNYKTIFATLHTIKSGDEIIAIVNGATYKYKIFSVSITSAEDTNIFSQAYDQSYLTIVTCTPPGTVWKRLVVRSKLEKIGKTAYKPAKKLITGTFVY